MQENDGKNGIPSDDLGERREFGRTRLQCGLSRFLVLCEPSEKMSTPQCERGDMTQRIHGFRFLMGSEREGGEAEEGREGEGVWCGTRHILGIPAPPLPSFLHARNVHRIQCMQ